MVGERERRSARLPRLASPISMIVAAIGLAMSPAEALAADEATVHRGRSLYEIHCRSCHGDDGRGGGSASGSLETAPPDLTRIRLDHDGTWPAEELTRVIDGRQEVGIHGRLEMPVWGLGFQNLERPEDQEREVEERIAALLEYLESIQRGVD